MAWIIPTSHSDPDGGWSNEIAAYDGSISTCATILGLGGQYSSYLLLLHSVFWCDKIKFYVDTDWVSITILWVDVYDVGLGNWVHVYDGEVPDKEWIEKNLDQSRNISQARIKLYKSSGPQNARLYEFNFNKIASVSLFGSGAGQSSGSAKISITKSFAATAGGSSSAYMMITLGGEVSFRISGSGQSSGTAEILLVMGFAAEADGQSSGTAVLTLQHLVAIPYLTDTDIANFALAKIGGAGDQQTGTGFIADINGTDPNSVRCKFLLPICRRRAITDLARMGYPFRETVWYADLRTQLLHKTIPEIGGWNYAFNLPINCLAVINQVDELSSCKKYQYSVVLNKENTWKVLLTNNLTNADGTSAYIEYCVDITDNSVFSMALIDCIAALLAAELCPLVGKDSKFRQQILVEYIQVCVPSAILFNQSQINNYLPQYNVRPVQPAQKEADNGN